MRVPLRPIPRWGLAVAVWLVALSAPVEAGWVNAGGSGTVADASGFEANHPVKKEFARAGVSGGIPDISHIKATLGPGDNIQSAIDNGGPGVVLLTAGTYVINSAITLKSGVILRGVNRDTVILSVRMTSTSKTFAFLIPSSVSFAGLERLTISYDATSQAPIDRANVNDGPYYDAAFQNNPHGLTNLYVGMVSIAGSNNWLNEVAIYKSGTDPILISGRNNTVRNSIISRCYNKGGGGNGYFDLRGDSNFIGGNTIKRIRHFAVQLGARHNVVIDNLIESDVNFHNGDDGQNLIERNVVNKPSWHAWRCFATGAAAYGHAPPGFGNVIFNNDAWDFQYGYDPTPNTSKIYTFTTYGEPTVTTWAYPSQGTFHPVKFLPGSWCGGDLGWTGERGLASESSGNWTVQGAGPDLVGTADGCFYIRQPIVGDVDISLRVVSQQNTNAWAKAGVMVRQWATPGSRHVSHFLTPENGTRIRARWNDGDDSTSWATDSSQGTGAWLRLVRVGSRFTAAVKQNDVWVPVGSSTVGMWAHAYAGFFVASVNANATSSVTFSNVWLSAPRDTDNDGLLDTEEWDGVTSANDWDSDNDGLSDGAEVNTRGTDPMDWDSDNDGLGDGPEVNVHGTDPLKPDSDGDGLWDNAELTVHGTSPSDRDSDDDGFDDGAEVRLGSLPGAGGDTPLDHVSGTDLINATMRNGSFELLGGLAVSAKATHWDSDPDGDVDGWTLWGAATGGPSSAANDSGTEVVASATHGLRIAFLQPGNAAFNETAHLIGEGDVFVFTWDWARAGRGSATVQLAYRDGSQIVALDDIGCASTSAGVVRTYGGGWVVPTGHPAIGKPIALTIRSGGNYPEVDNIRLLVQPTTDLDADGMDDAWETAHGLVVGTDDGGLDADHDGTDNLTEFRLGLIPDDGASRFAITTADGDPSDGFTFSWPSQPGLVFTVSRSADMDHWTEIEPAWNATQGTTTSFTDPAPVPVGGRYFYRVGLKP